MVMEKRLQGRQLLMQSGTAEIDQTAPINRWLKQKIHTLCLSDNAKKIWQGSLTPEDLSPENKNAGDNAETNTTDQLWRDVLQKTFYGARYSTRVMIYRGADFFREKPFSESEIKMLQWLIGSYQYTWIVLTKKNIRHSR